jgi:hypothetical protein
MGLSIFTDKSKSPDNNELKKALTGNYKLWNEIKEYVIIKYPEAEEEWKYAGKSFGWGYRLKDKKRVLVYFMPCDKYFKVSFVFGQKAADEALSSSISKDIKDIISSAKVYAEGRGFRIDVLDKKIINDIKKLVDIKLAN